MNYFEELTQDYPQYIEIPVGGYYSEFDFLNFIEPKESWILYRKRGFLHFGHAGIDGIEFGLRKGEQGIWAYYPIEDTYEKKADTVVELIERWKKGDVIL